MGFLAIVGVSTYGYSRYQWESIETFESTGQERPSAFAEEIPSEETTEQEQPKTEDGKTVAKPEPVQEIPEARELETFLFWSVGSNGVSAEQAASIGTRSGNDGLADVVMLVMSNGSEATVLRIPRDVWLDNKLSEIPNLHGGGVMEARIEAFTGVEIDHIATGNFYAVAQLVDRVGGVNVTPPKDISVNGKVIYEGGVTVLMDGEEAVRFSRMRNIYVGGEPGNDFNRIQNQGLVISALMEKKPDLLKNFNNIFTDLEGHVTISDSLNPEILLSHRNASIVSTETVEGLSFGWVGEKSVLVVSDPEAVEQQIQDMLDLLTD